MSSSPSSNSSTSGKASPLKRKREEEIINSESDAHSDASGSEEEAPPALSHAERRRQKKKTERQADASELSLAKRRKVNPSSTVPNRQNSIWVGNLSFKTTVESLRSFFESIGEITRIHMPVKVSTGSPATKPENRGLVCRNAEFIIP